MDIGFGRHCAIGMSSKSSYLDAFNQSLSSTSTSRKPTTSVRSRNRRLVSLIDGDNEDGTQQLTSTAPALGRSPLPSREATPSPYGSRRGSPLPTKHPASISIEPDNGSRGRRNDGNFSSESAVGGDITALRNRPRFATGLLESSWSSLQGLASSVLGSDVGWANSGTSTTAFYRQRKPSHSNLNISPLPKTSAPLWGPSAPSTSRIGAGTEEERRELVQAKRREVLLLANGDSVSDLKGRYKRRDSSDRPDQETTELKPDDDAFVYVHHVQPTDSVTGVTIRYGCQPAVLRKANGFWPSDSIQSRKVVLLPVESCSVKGRWVSSPNQDLLGDYNPRLSLEDMNGSSIYPVPVSTVDRLTDEANMTSEGDQQWKHEAWVEIEGFPTAVEIGRIPRRSLGFFPRTRRKSNSTTCTDDDRPPTSLYNSLSQFPSSPPLFPRSLRPSNDPFSSLSPSPDRSRVTKFGGDPSALAQHSSICLSGPGGVGSLGQDAKAPGPAPDSLNKFFAQHLPDLTAPPSIEHRKTSFESTSSTVPSNASSNGFDNVGGALESWMRKMATRAKAGLNELQQSGHGQQGHSPGHAIGISGFGDLIELNDGLEGTTPPVASTAAREYPVSSRSRSNPLSESSLLRERHPSPSAPIVGRARPLGFGLGAVPDDYRKKGEKGD